MEITDIHCQALQQKSQDILNAMQLVLTSKELLQNLRQDGWDAFLEVVKSFCEKKNIDIPDMSARYIMGRGRSYHQRDHIRFDIFIAAMDT